MENKVNGYMHHEQLDEQINLNEYMENIVEKKSIQTGMIMDGINQSDDQKQAKENLDATIGANQEKLLEAMARYKEAHTPKIKEYKIGRNDECPCGSHKKYKNCCLNTGKYEKYKLMN